MRIALLFYTGSHCFIIIRKWWFVCISFPTGTYNIQGVGLTRNHRNGTSCFQCIFLHNSQTKGCLLKLKKSTNLNSKTCSTTRNITIPQSNCSASELCFNDMYQGSYNIEVYDIQNNLNETASYSKEPQVLTNIDIEGLSCVEPEG